MRTILIGGAATLALASAAIVIETNAGAQTTHRATTKKKTVNKAKPMLRYESGWDSIINNGGPSGCLGPCPAATPTPVAVPTTLTRQYLVGTWVKATATCAPGPAAPLRLIADGHYYRPEDAGTWTLSRGKIVLSYRDVETAPGEYATADMERSAPVRSRAFAVTRVAADQIRLGGVAWRRCSTSPEY